MMPDTVRHIAHVTALMYQSLRRMLNASALREPTHVPLPDSMKQLLSIGGSLDGLETKEKGKSTTPLMSLPCWSRVISSYLHTRVHACMHACVHARQLMHHPWAYGMVMGLYSMAVPDGMAGLVLLA